MPYLHWELDEEVNKLKEVLKQKQKFLQEHNRTLSSRERQKITRTQAAKKIEAGDLNGTEKLYWMYLDEEHPLHIRRTLDQFYYHTFTQTDRRDNDQATHRYYKRHPPREKNVRQVSTMVDQLWMWVLPEIGNLPSTIITAFPQRCNRMVSPTSKSTTALMSNIIERSRELSIRSCHDLADIIASECSRIYFDATSDRNLSLQFLEIYTISIGEIVSASFHLTLPSYADLWDLPSDGW